MGNLKIVRREIVYGSGYYFSEPIDKFKNIRIQTGLFDSILLFEYFGRAHKAIIHKGRYGDYFNFNGRSYYVITTT